jgi:hypothetical protein
MSAVAGLHAVKKEKYLPLVFIMLALNRGLVISQG